MPDLNGAPRDQKIYNVSEITGLMKDLIEGEFPYVWIVGEVSNCSSHSSGHTYFTLKDDRAQIRCVLFGSSARHLRTQPSDGLKIYAQGRLTVYGKQGQYELIVNTMLAAGTGDLFLAFNKLKEKLEREGMFDPSRKKEIPAFPSRIGVVTSPTGAAVRDVIRMATRIHAGVEIVVYPVRVQGTGAREEIAAAVGDLNSIGGFDVIILTRGGGSIEDLWAFNEEMVARAISGSEIPIVSAVGHEVDFTIADFAADARAPTPSAAPALVLAGYVDVRVRLESALARTVRAVGGRIDGYAGLIAGLRSHYGLRGIEDRVYRETRDLDENLRRAERSLVSELEEARARLSSTAGKLHALSPLATLDRGYSICFRQDTGDVVRRCGQVDVGDLLRIRFSQGGATAEVKAVEEGCDG